MRVALMIRSGLGRVLRRLRGDERGNIAMVYALSLVVIIGSVGGAVDFARVYNARAKAQAVLDGAVLAAARVLQTTQSDSQAIAAALAYYNNHAPTDVTGAPTFSVHDSSSVLRGTLDASIPAPFLAVISMPTLPVTAQAEITLSGGGNKGSNMEVAVMLDVTGSMCDDGVGPCTTGTKISALKDAAKDLVNIVVWNNQNTYTSKVALVPFSTRIRVAPDDTGGSLMTALTGMPATWSGWYEMCVDGAGDGGSETNGNWTCNQYQVLQYNNWKIMPCVTDRTGPQEYTDAPPGSGTWLNAHDGSRAVISWDSGDNPLTSHRGLTSSDPAWHWNYGEWGGCADILGGNVIQPLTSDKSVLTGRIDALEAYGSTGGALGTAWAWYMLSPQWSGIWSGQSAPAPYSQITEIVNGAPKLRKVAILMTDGDFNTFRGWKDQDQVEVSDRARQICTNMKAAGIEIYSVAFGLDQIPAAKRAIAEQVLKDCGTDISHFYASFSPPELRAAFRDIALRIASTRISK